MIVRANLTVPDHAGARRLAKTMCSALSNWGNCKVLTLEPDHKHAGEFKLYVRVSGSGSRSMSVLPSIATALASGAWKYYDEDPDEAYAVWDLRDGGRSVVPEVSWLCVELHPEEDGGLAPTT